MPPWNYELVMVRLRPPGGRPRRRRGGPGQASGARGGDRLCAGSRGNGERRVRVLPAAARRRRGRARRSRPADVRGEGGERGRAALWGAGGSLGAPSPATARTS